MKDFEERLREASWVGPEESPEEAAERWGSKPFTGYRTRWRE